MAKRSLEERLALYRARFCYVEETYCAQQPAGHYHRAYAAAPRGGDPGTQPQPLALTDEVLEQHLRGQTTLAFYTAKRVGGSTQRARAEPVAPHPQTLCREGIMESDDKRTIPDPDRSHPGRVRTELVNGRELMRAAHLRLERAGIPSALELSRRGARVRVFAAEPVPARAMQNLLLYAVGVEERLRMARGETAVEINPKQDDLAPDKVGNSVRGPFGLHLKSGERYPFIHPDGRPVGLTLGAQIDSVLDIPTVDVQREVERRPWLEQERLGILEPLPAPRRQRTLERLPRMPGRGCAPLGLSPIERWKDAHPLVEILADYGVVATRSGTYHCPLPHHGRGDRRPSLSVDVERGVWFCHTAAIGGTAFDFLMAAEGLSTPSEAVAYLRGRGEIEVVGAERSYDGSDRR